MTREESCARRFEVLETGYAAIGPVVSSERYGSGHINDTFLTVSETGKRYILQRINQSVFPHPDEVVENIRAVTEHIAAKIAVEERSDFRPLVLVKTAQGKPYFYDSLGSYWRLYDFVEETLAKDTITETEQFGDCGEAFGRFQGWLSDFPAEQLHETIVNFHNTPVRFQNFLRAVEKDPVGRVAECRAEIEFVMARRDFCEILEKAHGEGSLPLRVTHNDTKLNNILFDAVTGKPACVIDLDTVMPGYSVNDFGDSIRFGANTAVEDETDLSKVSLDLTLYHAYAKGFLRGCGGKLTEKEIELLPIGAMMMTLECGMRFLADYIENDIYFRVKRPSHNLDRARCQLALFADMEKKLEQMKLN